MADGPHKTLTGGKVKSSLSINYITPKFYLHNFKGLQSVLYDFTQRCMRSYGTVEGASISILDCVAVAHQWSPGYIWLKLENDVEMVRNKEVYFFNKLPQKSSYEVKAVFEVVVKDDDSMKKKYGRPKKRPLQVVEIDSEANKPRLNKNQKKQKSEQQQEQHQIQQQQQQQQQLVKPQILYEKIIKGKNRVTALIDSAGVKIKNYTLSRRQQQEQLLEQQQIQQQQQQQQLLEKQRQQQPIEEHQQPDQLVPHFDLQEFLTFNATQPDVSHFEFDEDLFV